MSLLDLLLLVVLGLAQVEAGKSSECPPCKRISDSNSLGPDWAGLYHLHVGGSNFPHLNRMYK